MYYLPLVFHLKIFRNSLEQPKPEQNTPPNTPTGASKGCQCTNIGNFDKYATANFEEADPDIRDQEVQAKTSSAGDDADKGCQCPDPSEFKSCDCRPEIAKAKRISKDSSYKVYSVISLKKSQKAFTEDSAKRTSIGIFQKRKEDHESLDAIDFPENLFNGAEAFATSDNFRSISNESKPSMGSYKSEEMELNKALDSTSALLKIKRSNLQIAKPKVNDTQTRISTPKSSLNKKLSKNLETPQYSTVSSSKVFPSNSLAAKSSSIKIKTPEGVSKMPSRVFPKYISKTKQNVSSTIKHDDEIFSRAKPNASSCTPRKSNSVSKINESVVVVHKNKICDEPECSSSVLLPMSAENQANFSSTDYRNGYFCPTQWRGTSNLEKSASNDSILDLVETIKYRYTRTENDYSAASVKNILSGTGRKPSPVKHQPFFLVPQNHPDNICENILNLYPLNWSIANNNQSYCPQFPMKNRTYTNQMAFIYPEPPKYSKNPWAPPVTSMESKILHKKFSGTATFEEYYDRFCNSFTERYMMPWMTSNVCHRDCAAQTDEVKTEASVSPRKRLGIARNTNIMVYQEEDSQRNPFEDNGKGMSKYLW